VRLRLLILIGPLRLLSTVLKLTRRLSLQGGIEYEDAWYPDWPYSTYTSHKASLFCDTASEGVPRIAQVKGSVTNIVYMMRFSFYPGHRLTVPVQWQIAGWLVLSNVDLVIQRILCR
jgi:hypothetical protein